MKRIALLLTLAFVLTGSTSASGFPEVPTNEFDLKAYGEKQAGMVEIRILGSGVARPGRYFVSEKTSVLEAVQRAGLTEPKFAVNRSRTDAQQRIECRFVFDTRSEVGVKKAKAFLLEEGDVVMVAQPII